jgi:hypothetical protein
MSPLIRPNIDWKKLSAIGGVIVVVWQIAAYVYSGIEANKEAIEKAAIERVTREQKWEEYKRDIENRLEVVEHACPFSCVDSIKDAINELDQKTHLKPKF